MRIINIERVENRNRKEYGSLATIEVPTGIETIHDRQTNFQTHLGKWIEIFSDRARDEHNASIAVFVSDPLRPC